MTRDELLAAATRRVPRGSGFDRCVPTVRAMIDDLAAKGVHAAPMRLKGAKADMPDADRRWRAIPRHGWVHYVAWVEEAGVALDATGRQFGLDAVRALAREEVERDWDEVLILE